MKHELEMARRLLARRKDSCGKLYSMHAPEVEGINKGKAHQHYEFGVKASVSDVANSPKVTFDFPHLR